MKRERKVKSCTSPNWAYTSIQPLTVLGSPQNSDLESRLGKVPGSVSTPRVRLQIAAQGSVAYDTRRKTDIISLRANMPL